MSVNPKAQAVYLGHHAAFHGAQGQGLYHCTFLIGPVIADSMGKSLFYEEILTHPARRIRAKADFSHVEASRRHPSILAIPRMRYLWAMVASTPTGMIPKTARADMVDQRTPWAANILEITTEGVVATLRVRVRANMDSIQEKMKRKKAVTARP